MDLLFYVTSAGPGSERLVLSQGRAHFPHVFRGATDLFDTIASRSREAGVKARVSTIGVISARQEEEVRAVGKMLALVGLNAAL